MFGGPKVEGEKYAEEVRGCLFSRNARFEEKGGNFFDSRNFKEEKMKRFWLVLLSLGLIVAFSTSAMALDVKFSGEYYAAGLYLDKTNVTKSTTSGNPSTAFYFQRLRLGTQFVVSPGLSLIARADIMERAWGASRSVPGGGAGAADILSAGTRAENENIAFDLLYVSYASAIGLFNVGYQIDGAWGTVYGDSSQPTPKIAYYLPLGSFGIGLQMGKNPDGEQSRTAINAATAADRDDGFYTAFVRYGWKGGDAGFLFKHIRNAKSRDLTPGVAGFTVLQYAFVPYVKAKVGPVALQAEFTYAMGKAPKWEGTSIPGLTVDADLNAMSGWLDATADLGMFYAGGTFAFATGDDLGTADKIEGGLTGGRDWNPCLIMFNNDLNYWAGNIAGYGGTNMTAPMTNAYFLQARAGVRPIDKLDIALSLSWATADKTLGGLYTERDMGTEIDLTATYKITNNLSYMLGGGYWMVGDYFKGDAVINNDLQDNFLILNKLTLTF